MTKPRLPKRWKGLKWGSVALSAPYPAYPRLAAFNHGDEYTVSLHDADRMPCAIVTSYRKVPLRRLVRAVEIAAIHAGLVEDRDG